MDIDMFVNSNPANVNMEPRWNELIAQGADEDTLMWETLPIEFSANMPAENTANHDADSSPVIVYMQDGVMVGWYDCENLVGYRA